MGLIMRRFLAVLVLWLVAAPAWSYYGTAGAPAGWGGSAGQWFFGGPGTQGAAWVGGQANVGSSFAGRTIPARLTLGPGAAQAIVRAALLTPYGRAASFIAFAVSAGWVWSEAEQSWMVPGTQPAAASPVVRYCTGTTINCQPVQAIYWSPEEACAAVVSVGLPPYVVPDVNYGICRYSTNGTSYNAQRDIGAGTVTVPNCSGAAPDSNGECPDGTQAPATQADADTIAQTMPAPVPDAVANEAQEFVPLPQALPEVQPSRIPTGAPVPQGTEPETYRQPVTDITPAPTTNEPWRVDATPREIVGSSPTGVTDVQHLDGSQDPATEEETPGLCDQYPDIVACQQLGDPPSDDVPSRVEAVQYVPESIGGSSGCPAPIPMGDHQLTFTELCDNLTSIRPLVIALGFFIAAMVIVNALRA